MPSTHYIRVSYDNEEGVGLTHSMHLKPAKPSVKTNSVHHFSAIPTHAFLRPILVHDYFMQSLSISKISILQFSPPHTQDIHGIGQ